MPNLTSADWLIVLIYGFFTLTAGFSLRPSMTGSCEYFEAGRALPAWLCGLAFAATGLGLLVSSGMGARYGFASVPFVIFGSVPAMLFLGLFLMPLYRGSKARTVPEYLALRFDAKTRLLAACLFLVSAATGAAFSLFAMARVFAALHVFDTPLHSAGAGTAFVLSMALPAALVLAYVLLGGLAGSIYAQAMQFFVAVAGFLPVVLLGLKQIGWSGLKAAAASAGSTYAQAWNGGSLTGFSDFLFAAFLGLVFGAGFWCVDFRVLQSAMAAKDTESARRTPLIAAAAWVLLPLLFLLPGIVALGLPTPHTTISIRNENGAIYHDITVAPPAAEAGQGLVPAVMDPATGKPLKTWGGRNLLDDSQAVPNTVAHFLPMGLLGLGIAALLACMMCGVSACITAMNAVFAYDIYQPFLHKSASDKQMLTAGRWTAAAGMALAFGLACAVFCWHWKLETVAILFARINAPLLAAILLGMFWKRATGHGAFVGIALGFAATLLPTAVFSPLGAWLGVRSLWAAAIARLHYQNGFAPSFWTVIAGFAVSLLATAAVSAWTKARPEAELRGTVYSLTAPKPAMGPWWKRPEALAAAILLAAIAVSLIFY